MRIFFNHCEDSFGCCCKNFWHVGVEKNKDVNLSKTKFWARLLKNSLDTKFLVENHEGVSFLRVGGQNYFIGRGGGIVIDLLY